MKRLQFSVLTLLLAVTFTGVGCAALVNASATWSASLLSATVLLLLAATLAAVYAGSRLRTFAGGFAIAGWAYLLLNMANVIAIESYLITRTANDALYAAMHPSPPSYYMGNAGSPPYPYVTYAAASTGVNAEDLFAPATPASGPVDLTPSDIAQPATSPYSYYAQTVTAATAGYVDPGAFNRIGHSLWTILLGALGGAAATWFAGLKERRVEQ